MSSLGNLVVFLALTTTIARASPVASTSSSSKSATATSTPASWNGCNYVVPNVGSFNSRIHIPEGQWAGVVDNATQDKFQSYSGPYGPGQFESSLVTVGPSGNLNLKVVGGTVSPAPSSEILTYWTDILYGSVRVVASGSTNNGSIYGMFFYGENDTSGILSETDIELRTTYPDLAYFSDQYPNYEQSPQPDADTNSSSLSQNISVSHEYRIDWMPSQVTFFIDGVSQEVMTQYVPTGPTGFYINSWSTSGGWPAGPNAINNTFIVRSFDMYVNRTSQAGKCNTYVQ